MLQTAFSNGWEIACKHFKLGNAIAGYGLPSTSGAAATLKPPFPSPVSQSPTAPIAPNAAKAAII